MNCLPCSAIFMISSSAAKRNILQKVKLDTLQKKEYIQQ